MIYGKLPVVFLSVIASEKSGSTNSIIADYILNHMDEVKNLGIKEIAERCHVGTGSVSRFCKDIGLQDFVELRELLSTTGAYFEYQKENLFRGRDKREWPRIWMISGRQKSFPEYAAKVLDFQSLQDQAGHPYQLLYVAGLIAQEYGRIKNPLFHNSIHDIILSKQ